MSEAVELDDFKEDLKLINQKLDTLNKQLEKDKDLNSKNVFTSEKVMVKRDINRLFLNTSHWEILNGGDCHDEEAFSGH